MYSSRIHWVAGGLEHLKIIGNMFDLLIGQLGKGFFFPNNLEKLWAKQNQTDFRLGFIAAWQLQIKQINL